jgi:hypothetical protein
MRNRGESEIQIEVSVPLTELPLRPCCLEEEIAKITIWQR